MKLIFLFFFFLFCSMSNIFALDDANTTQPLTEQQIKELQQQQLKEKQEQEEAKRLEKITIYENKLREVDNKISEDNSWIKSYSSYLTSLKIKKNLKKIKKRIKYLSKHAKKSSDRDELNGLISKENILSLQVNKLKGEDSAPFVELITPPKLPEFDSVKNPFDIFTGFSIIKTLDVNLEDYKSRSSSLQSLIVLLRQEINIYTELLNLDASNLKYKKFKKEKQIELERLETAYDTIKVTLDVYQKRLELLKVNINKGIEKQIYRLVKIGAAILIVFIIFFLLKLIVKKYITDNERFYTANKVITFTNFTIIVLILFFNYIENVSYLVTILGFASAGIAIAMKDWFMSILGWLVIVFGGSIHVGDRIRVDMEGLKYVGDVMDISLLRMTILEDITLTSITQNRRAGRIIFVPNNYVFTRMIANYSHASLKTVWDGIKITITFDSNHKKALHLAKEISKKYSKGYTDITRKQLNKLRNHYSLKNTNVEPRIYSFIAENGLDIEAWYLTNAYGTLTLRSVISAEIVDAFNEADDITIAYPTQKLNVSMNSEVPNKHDHEMV